MAGEQKPSRARTRCSCPCMESEVLTKNAFHNPGYGWPGIKGVPGGLAPGPWDSKGYAAIPFGPRGVVFQRTRGEMGDVPLSTSESWPQKRLASLADIRNLIPAIKITQPIGLWLLLSPNLSPQSPSQPSQTRHLSHSQLPLPHTNGLVEIFHIHLPPELGRSPWKPYRGCPKLHGR